MRYVHSAPLYAVVAAALLGCGKEQPSALETKVATATTSNVAHASSDKKELDLSTPEKFVSAYVLAYNQALNGKITAEEFLSSVYHNFSQSDVEYCRKKFKKTGEVVALDVTTSRILRKDVHSDGSIDIELEWSGNGFLKKTNETKPFTEKNKIKITQISGQYKRIDK